MNHTQTYLLVFVGGGIGSIARHAVNQLAARSFGIGFPYGTLFVNIAGSVAIGCLAGWFALRGRGNHQVQLFLTVGVLGGFTTFSAFSLDTALLWERGQTWTAISYALGSVLGAVTGVFGGLLIMRGHGM